MEVLPTASVVTTSTQSSSNISTVARYWPWIDLEPNEDVPEIVIHLDFTERLGRFAITRLPSGFNARDVALVDNVTSQEPYLVTSSENGGVWAMSVLKK